jgi:ATP-dependent DNA helicase RecQ
VKRTPVSVSSSGSPLFDRLKDWRRSRASTDGVPAYVIFHDKTLAEIARARPGSLEGLAGCSGVGQGKLDRYGAAVLAVVSEAQEAA